MLFPALIDMEVTGKVFVHGILDQLCQTIKECPEHGPSVPDFFSRYTRFQWKAGKVLMPLPWDCKTWKALFHEMAVEHYDEDAEKGAADTVKVGLKHGEVYAPTKVDSMEF